MGGQKAVPPREQLPPPTGRTVANETRQTGSQIPRHGTSTGPARYHCSICSRPFDRRDTLSRHMQVHSKDRLQGQTRRKACIPCSQSKIRCSTEHPTCRSCLKRKISCFYEKNRRPQQSHPDNAGNSPEKSNRKKSTTNRNVEENPSGNVSNYGLLLSPVSGGDPNQPEFADWLVNSPRASSGDQADFAPQRPDPNTGDIFMDDTLLDFDNGDFNSNLGWIFDNNFDGVAPDHYVFSPSTNSGSPLDAHAPPDQIIHAVSSLPGQTDDRDSLVAPIDRFSCVGGRLPPEEGSWGSQWLSRWRTENGKNQIILPPLGEGLPHSASQPRFYSTVPINESTSGMLQEFINLPFERTPWQSVKLDRFPSNSMLDYCIDLYFANWNKMLPIIHQPTFDPEQDPVITLSIVCIGACYTRFSEARAFSNTLSEIIYRLQELMTEYDPRHARTESYLTTRLLQGVHSYSSGSERLFELGELCRSSLVYQAKCIGLLRYETPESSTHGASIEQSWIQWVRRERSRRLGWAIYEFDASTAYIHNNRPFLSTGDIGIPLPSSHEPWEAASAQAWATFQAWTTSHRGTPLLRPLIRSLFNGSEKPLEKITEQKQQYYAILTLVRMLWTFKEIKSSPVSDLVPDGVDMGRYQLLQALDRFVESRPPMVLVKSHTRQEMVRIIHCMQLRHIGHIYGAGDLMNWLYPSLNNGLEAENARLRMSQWANEDPRRTRDIAYRCAQILSLARQYPSNMPLEPSIVFHAGLVLWCMARLLSPINTIRTPDSSDNAYSTVPYVRLDHLGFPDDAASVDAQSWVQNGGCNVIGLHGVPSLCCDPGRRHVLEQSAEMLKHHRIWGISQNFARALLSLRDERHDKNDSATVAGRLPVVISTLCPSAYPRGN